MQREDLEHQNYSGPDLDGVIQYPRLLSDSEVQKGIERTGLGRHAVTEQSCEAGTPLYRRHQTPGEHVFGAVPLLPKYDGGVFV
ncbi:hypothetical protein EYF80_039380 [Liparis tanakae]|uniref:Uncharacterized protein n=1 Tax=Liparis tanakae TaxID=230148 RepID=A0A4Z2GCM8_9TELE|nr:hypothetical protein EYF80_039380 [Liparis tanakae]